MIISCPLKNIWPILVLSMIISGLTACGGANFTSIPDNFSHFRSANLLASDQISLKAGQDVLKIGGNAADATVAMGFAAMVSLPARMGLEARGHCVGYDSANTTAFRLDFNRTGYHAVHGLSALHAGFGNAPWAGVLAPAQRLALLGGSRLSHELNGGSENAPQHLTNADGTIRPRPILLQALQTLIQYPTNYAQFAPFRNQPKWQNRLSLDAPRALNVDGSILAYAGASAAGATASSIIFGAVDASGLGISCSAGYAQPYGEGWNAALDTATPTADHPVTLPRNFVSYNDQNHRVRWLAAFAPNTSESTILNSWNALLEQNRPNLSPTLGFAMSYCPIGLPNKQINKGLSCATYSGALKDLGRAVRY